MRVRAVLLAFLLGAGCRSSHKGAPDAVAPPARLTVESVRGWWIGPQATGYWIAPDAVRVVSGEHSDRLAVQSINDDFGALKLELEGSPAMRLSSRDGGLSVKIGDSKPIDVRRASDLEERELEKRDARALLATAHACERAVSCCRAATGKGLANADECAPLALAKELGQCVRALKVFARKASEAKIELPACATSAAPSP